MKLLGERAAEGLDDPGEGAFDVSGCKSGKFTDRARAGFVGPSKAEGGEYTITGKNIEGLSGETAINGFVGSEGHLRIP